MFSIGAFAIIFDDDDGILLSHRRDFDAWNLPGGGLQSRELPDEAVMREVKEETGLEVTIERLVGIYGKMDKDELVFAFVCRVISGELSISDEADEHRFFTVDRIPPNTLSKQVERIHDALLPAGPPIFRHQSGPSTRAINTQV